MGIDIYSGILKMFNDFGSPSEYALRFTYEFLNENFNELKAKYSINDIAGNGNDFSKAVNLLHWVSKNIYHKGNYDGNLPNHAITLLSYSYQAEQKRGINCRSLATILTECCLAIGIHARTIHLMPCSPYDGDNHVVTSAYIKELQRWMMLDPTYNCYLRDKTGNVLSVFDIRRILSEKGDILFNDETNYNGQNNAHLHEEIKEYLAKNMFYFWCREHNTYGSDDGKGGRMVVCSPSAYSVDKAKKVNLRWRISQCGDNEYMSIWKKEIAEEKIRISENDFICSPIYA